MILNSSMKIGRSHLFDSRVSYISGPVNPEIDLVRSSLQEILAIRDSTSRNIQTDQRYSIWD